MYQDLTKELERQKTPHRIGKKNVSYLTLVRPNKLSPKKKKKKRYDKNIIGLKRVNYIL